jgi:two-component system chemotaxis response regulator CheY
MAPPLKSKIIRIAEGDGTMGKKIMLVDDAAFMRMTIKNTLTKAGYTELVEAGDGQQAVETYDKEHPDLVIMDITMPNMDGIQALQAIKGKDAGAKVVMCSAMGQEAMVVEAIRLGAMDFIVKPFKPDRILQTVQKILG